MSNVVDLVRSHARGDMDKFVGRQFQLLREATKLTGAEMAARLKLSRYELAAIEQGIRRADVQVIMRACLEFYVSPGHFYRGLKKRLPPIEDIF